MADEKVLDPKFAGQAIMRPTPRRTTGAIIDNARRRLAKTLEFIPNATGMPRANWSDDQKKFYDDLNAGPKEAPAYLKLLQAALPRLVEPDPLQRGAGIQIAIVTTQVSAEEWEARAKAQKKIDEMERAGLIDIVDAPRLEQAQPEAEGPRAADEKDGGGSR